MCTAMTGNQTFPFNMPARTCFTHQSLAYQKNLNFKCKIWCFSYKSLHIVDGVIKMGTVLRICNIVYHGLDVPYSHHLPTTAPLRYMQWWHVVRPSTRTSIQIVTGQMAIRRSLPIVMADGLDRNN